MGTRGPVPKRDDERVRRNTTGEDGLAVQAFTMDDDVVIPKAVFDDPEVQGLWEAIKKSVNVKYYEPSDWAYAILALRQWDKAVQGGRLPGAMMLGTLDGMLKQLAITESERRRLKIEAVRGSEQVEIEKASNVYQMLLQRGGQSA